MSNFPNCESCEGCDAVCDMKNFFDDLNGVSNEEKDKIKQTHPEWFDGEF